MLEVGTPLKLDIGQPLAALNLLIAGEVAYRTEQQKTSALISTNYTEMVRQAMAYSDSLKRQQDEVRNAAAATRSAVEEVRRLTAANQELAAAAKKSTNADEVKRLGQEIAKNTAKIKEAKQAIQENKAATDQERQAVTDLVEARRQSVNQTKLGAAAARDVAAAGKQETAAAREAAAAAKDQAEAEKKAAAEADKEVRNAGLLVQLERQLADLTERRARATTKSEAQGYKGQIDSVSGQIAELKNGPAAEGEGFFSGLASKAAAATAGFFAFNEISRRVKQGLEDYGAIKGVQATLTAVAGSATKGAEEFAYIKREANGLGLELVPTAKAYTGLFAAAKEANLSVATTRDVFEGVAGAAKVLNLTAGDTNGVLLALQQIASKGTVASEELRGQIGERLPGAFQLAAKAMGLTTAELGKQLQAGKVLAVDFLPKFAAQLKATYGDATADASAQVGSNLGRINTFFSESSAKVGQAVAPYVAALAALVTPLKTTAQVAQDSANAYFKQADATKALIQTVTPLLARYEQLTGTTNRNATEQKELDSIIQQLAKSVPGAVTEFDKYGKALGLNGEAIKKYIANSQNLTRYRNRDALRDNSADFRRLASEREELQKQLNNTVTGADGLKRRQAAEAISGGTGGGGAFVRTLSQAESDKITADYTAKLAQVQLDIDANLLDRDSLRGLSPLLPKTPTPAEIQGLIEKQQQIIKDLKARQIKAADENKGDGGDFLFGKGGLNRALDAAEKELARLEGKVTKGRKTSDDALQARLRALFNERQTLSELAAKAAEKQSSDENERARLSYEAELAGIEKIRKALIQKELDVAKAARKRGGEALVKKQGANADGVIDGVQAAEIDNFKASAEERLTKELARIEREREALLLSLREDGDQTELDRLEAAFNEQVRLQVNNAGVLLALEAKYERDRQALLEKQATTRAQREKSLSSSQADATSQVYGGGTGQSVYEAGFSAQQQQLDADRTFAEKRLDILKDNHSKEADEERAALAAQLLRIRNQQIALNAEQTKSKFSLYRLVLGENDSPELRAALDEVVGVVQSSLSNILQAEQQAAAQKASDATQQINELTGRIAIEQALQESGSASNLAGLRQELAEQRQIRKDAQREQRESAQAQVILDGIIQASNLITSISNIFAGSSKLDLLLPGAGTALAIGLSSVLVGAFLTSKFAAYEAAGKSGGGFRRGGFTGGTSEAEVRGEVHGKEFVHTAEKTAKYRELFEALHTDTPQMIDWHLPHMRALLPVDTTVLLPDLELPSKLRQEKAEALRVQHEHTFAPMKQDFDRLHARLEAIEASNLRMADQPARVPLGPRTYLEVSENGSTHVKNL